MIPFGSFGVILNFRKFALHAGLEIREVGFRVERSLYKTDIFLINIL